MFRVYYIKNNFRFEVGTYATEKEARKAVARKDKYGKWSFIERIIEA